MTNFGFVIHPRRQAALDLTQSIVTWLANLGHKSFLLDASDEIQQKLSLPILEQISSELDLIISLGGDGTVLRAVDLACNYDLPVLGINLGHLGYLSEVEPLSWRNALQNYLDGNYKVEQRLTIEVELDPKDKNISSASKTISRIGLNEAVVEKASPGRSARMSISLGGRHFITYTADGVIISTPTGSTAYNLSARGPIVSPLLEALVLTPVAPHTLFDRSLVLDASQQIRVEMVGGAPIAVVVDGHEFVELCQGDAVICRTGKQYAHFVTFDSRDFHGILKTKFGLNF